MNEAIRMKKGDVFCAKPKVKKENYIVRKSFLFNIHFCEPQIIFYIRYWENNDSR